MLETILVVGAGALCIVGLFFEDKLIAFEDRIIEKFKNRKVK